MNWNGAQTDAVGVYKKAQGGENPTSIATVAAEIKQEVKKEEEKKQAPVKAPVAAKPKPAAKAPVKVLRFKTWELSNYGDETVVFPAAEVNPGMAFNLFNCEKTKIVVEGKFKNMMLSRCKKVQVTVDELISTLEVIKSEDIKVNVSKKCPTISVELTQGIVITATQESKKNINIMTTASQSVSMVVPKTEGTYDPNDDEEDPNKQLVVPESFLSKINDKDEIVVEPQVGFD